jgi:cyanophycin synthetase
VELLDSRRITGPNILSAEPGAIIDVRLDDDEQDRFLAAWQESVREMLGAVGWGDRALHVRRVAGGASLGFEAPVDALYAATEINDWAFEAAKARARKESAPPLEPAAIRIRQAIAQETNPPLVALRKAAAHRGVPFISDDDYVSLGLGRHSRTWRIRETPSPAEVPWESLGSIPTGLVTGTNGKTTTVRLAAAMAAASGRVVGLSSTDRVVVAGQIVDEGDYAGPGGARAVLRDPRVEIAVLETARGGLLRRGAAVHHADACVITNIAADHLDDFGVRDLDALTDVKWVVTRVLGETGTAVLNAEDPRLVARASALRCPVTWFAMTPAALNGASRPAPVRRAFVRDGDRIVLVDDGRHRDLLGVEEIPLAFGGAARHNVANCLAAMGLADALGVGMDAIIQGARETTDAANPGRCNVFRIGGARVLVDFAHNPDGLQALQPLADHLAGSGRRLLLIGQAGDRGDDAIRQLGRAACGLRPDRVLLKEMGHYSRGRAPGEVAGLLRQSFLDAGVSAGQISYIPEELDAVRDALDWLQPGDLAILLVHEDIASVTDLISKVSQA